MPKKQVQEDLTKLNNLVVISDTHCGCRVGLCHPDGVELDDGGIYKPSEFQMKMWGMWTEFWQDFVPEATRGEPFGVVHNGDALDGVHHGATTQISHNLEDQTDIAYKIMKPVVDAAEGRYWHIRGTEAHVGKSAREEERLARQLGAIRNREGQAARYDLWKMLGGEKLIHFLHHVGTTSSQGYESTAVHKELIEEYIEAARWGRRPPDMIVRSHRHRHYECIFATKTQGAKKTSRAWSAVTPSWQGKTPFVWKVAGGRLTTPQFGGLVIRYAHDELFVRSFVCTVDRSPTE